MIIDNYSILIYDSPREILEAYWGNLSDVVMVGGVDETGKEIESSLDETIAAILELGIWGFSNQKDNSIHLWLDKESIIPERLIEFLAHEKGHFLFGKIDTRIPADENFCELCSESALFAYRTVLKMLDTINNDKVVIQADEIKKKCYDCYSREGYKCTESCTLFKYQQFPNESDICGICGKPGANVRVQKSILSATPYVHSECEKDVLRSLEVPGIGDK